VKKNDRAERRSLPLQPAGRDSRPISVGDFSVAARSLGATLRFSAYVDVSHLLQGRASGEHGVAGNLTVGLAQLFTRATATATAGSMT